MENSAAGQCSPDGFVCTLSENTKQRRLIEPQFAASFLQEAKQRMGQPGLPFFVPKQRTRENTHTHTHTTHTYTHIATKRESTDNTLQNHVFFFHK